MNSDPKVVAEKYDITVEEAENRINNTKQLRERMKRDPKEFIATIGMGDMSLHHTALLASMRMKDTGHVVLMGTPPRRQKKIMPEMLPITSAFNQHRKDNGHNPDMIIVDEYNHFDFSTIEPLAMASLTVKGHNGKIIAKEVDMPEDGESKLDYQARYKRVGDMILDKVTKKLIPVRTCPKDIKRALKIR